MVTVLEASLIKRLARAEGFELVGVAPATPIQLEAAWYQEWVHRGFAATMSYLTDHRAKLRNEANLLLSSSKSIICLGKLYNTPGTATGISRYAWGEDYHRVMRRALKRLVRRLQEYARFEYRIGVDTLPLLERVYARRAGLGWIGKNTCLINEKQGSWLFLGEILVSVEIEPDAPPPDRCGTCRRCIDACPTQALVQIDGRWELDSRKCISYLTIEHRGEIDPALRPGMGNHVFGCDICQDVCPWNRRAPVTGEPAFQPKNAAVQLAELAALTEDEFRERFRGTAVLRAKYDGFRRNVEIAVENARITRAGESA